MISRRRYISLTFKISVVFVLLIWLLTAFYLMLTYGQAFSHLNQSIERELTTKLYWIKDVLSHSLVKEKKILSPEQIEPLLKKIRIKTDVSNIYIVKGKERKIYSALPLPFPVTKQRISRALQDAFNGQDISIITDREEGKWAFTPLPLGNSKDVVLVVFTNWQNAALQWQAIKTNHILFFLSVMVLSLLAGLFLSLALTRPIRQLLAGLKRVESGDLRHKIRESYLLGLPVEDELSEMAKVFNQMTESLYQKNAENRALYEEINAFNRELTNKVKAATRELQEANEQLMKQKQNTDKDLRLARGIQAALLPRSLKMGSLSIEARCYPALDIGGDFYAFFPLDEEHIAMLIGDVSGRGISAALLMSFVYGIFLEAAHNKLSPSKTLQLANETLCHHILPDNPQFVTSFYCIYHLPTGKLKFSNAGHYPPILIRNGKTEMLRAEGSLLGVFPEMIWAEQTMSIQRNDLLFFFTDGLVEAKSPGGDRLEVSGLKHICQHRLGTPFPELIDKIMEDVLDFTKEDQLDDMAIMLMKANETIEGGTYG